MRQKKVETLFVYVETAYRKGCSDKRGTALVMLVIESVMDLGCHRYNNNIIKKHLYSAVNPKFEDVVTEKSEKH